MSDFVGRIAWFNANKGFGFISRDGEADVFCHYSSILADGYKKLAEGDLVEFNIIQGEKGPQADKVRKVG